MLYYGVLAVSRKFHGSEPLTYSFDKNLQAGALVTIPLKNQVEMGIVISKVEKPSFATKSIETVLDLALLPAASLKLIHWLSYYYPAPLGIIASLFLPSGLEKLKFNYEYQYIQQVTSVKLPPLTKDQNLVIKAIKTNKQAKTFIIHGDTGTGKSRVYLELTKNTTNNGQSVLILTPEIGLTPQLVQEFKRTIGHQVIVWHSGLTQVQRRQTWYEILASTQPVVVIGPRSALFVPFNELGLIVVDEAHDTAYKQDQQPYYQTIRVAGQLAKFHKALFIMGSATPSVADYYFAEAKKVPILRMDKLAIRNTSIPTKVSIVNGRDKPKFQRSTIISDDLIDAITSSLDRREQALIFLNRRGTARQVLCQNCGWQAMCPNCDLPVTYHGDHYLLRCHTCGYKTKALTACPICSSQDIIYKNLGTKSVVESLTKLFPKVKIQRFDADNNKQDRFEQHYNQISAGNVDIIVGTQILVKGLDLPKLSLVGVLNADSSLSFPDYMAEEQTYQLLSQIIGRVGRGHRSGQAIIQTYQPDSPAITQALSKNWSEFYDTQLSQRQKFLFPPYCYLLKLTGSRKTTESAMRAAETLHKHLLNLGLKLQILNPSPSFHEKSKSGYSWQLVVKAKDRSELLKLIKALPSGWSYDLDPTNLL